MCCRVRILVTPAKLKQEAVSLSNKFEMLRSESQGSCIVQVLVQSPVGNIVHHIKHK